MPDEQSERAFMFFGRATPPRTNPLTQPKPTPPNQDLHNRSDPENPNLDHTPSSGHSLSHLTLPDSPHHSLAACILNQTNNHDLLPDQAPHQGSLYYPAETQTQKPENLKMPVSKANGLL